MVSFLTLQLALGQSLTRSGRYSQMQPPMFTDGKSYSSWKRRLDRALGEINVVLVALAIGLAVLDITCFVAFTANAEIRRAHGSSQEVQLSVQQAWPAWLPFPQTPALASATGQHMDPL